MIKRQYVYSAIFACVATGVWVAEALWLRRMRDAGLPDPMDQEAPAVDPVPSEGADDAQAPSPDPRFAREARGA